MPVPVLVALTLASLSSDAVLRSGCSGDDTPVASLPVGTAVEIRSSLSGDAGTCYKVSGTVDGKTVMGYVPARSVTNASGFDEARKAGRGIGGGGGPAPAMDVGAVVQRAGAKATREHPAKKAHALIEANQPAEALAMLEKDLQRYPSDAYLHAVAGLAYYRMDNLDRALWHWKESHEIDPNPSVQAMIDRVNREKGADKGSERMVGSRVALRYDRSLIPTDLARSMLQVLDDEYTRISVQLGCRASERVTAVAASREGYMQATQAAEWSGGLYDGRIHVPVSATREVSLELRRTFAHELVHACLYEMGQWPSWLHEGLAQKYSGAPLPAGMLAEVKAMSAAGKLPKLSQLGRGWGGMSSGAAAVAYAMARIGVEKLLELKANTGLAIVLRDPAGFAQVEREVESALGL